MRINELEVNMQAVCCLRLYVPVIPSAFIKNEDGLCDRKARNNARQCFIYLKRISKAFSKGFNVPAQSHYNISNISFFTFSRGAELFLSKSVKMVAIQYLTFITVAIIGIVTKCFCGRQRIKNSKNADESSN